jgi:hypothetical protein
MKLTTLRKIIIGFVAVVAVAVMAIPSEVFARGSHGGWHGGGFHGGFRGYRGYGFYGYPYGYGAYGCYRTIRVPTPYGLTFQRVWVCG